MAVILLSIRRLCSDILFFFFSSRRRHTRFDCDWSSDVCSSDLNANVHRGAYGLAIRATEAYEAARAKLAGRSEEHTSELQSQSNLVCRLLLEKKKNKSAHRAAAENRPVHILGLRGRPREERCGHQRCG